MEVFILEDIEGAVIDVFDSIAAIREFYLDDDSYFPHRQTLTDEEYQAELKDEEFYISRANVICATKKSASTTTLNML